MMKVDIKVARKGELGWSWSWSQEAENFKDFLECIVATFISQYNVLVTRVITQGSCIIQYRVLHHR